LKEPGAHVAQALEHRARAMDRFDIAHRHQARRARRSVGEPDDIAGVEVREDRELVGLLLYELRDARDQDEDVLCGLALLEDRRSARMNAERGGFDDAVQEDLADLRERAMLAEEGGDRALLRARFDPREHLAHLAVELLELRLLDLEHHRRSERG